MISTAKFIGRVVCKRLLKRDDSVIGIDNFNDYYDQELKYGCLATLCVTKNIV